MNVSQVKQTAREWVEAGIKSWDGLRAAHFVGGITTMAEDAPFPGYKDVDLHLIFDDGSPALVPQGPFSGNIEVAYRGLPIEAGLKSLAMYASPKAVLANPEIAHHLTVDSAIYDPDGLLRDLRGPVTNEYPRRRWVLARCDYERRGLESALGRLPMARQMLGASGVMQIVGYGITFVGSLLSVATLQAPTTGSRVTLRTRNILNQYGRSDLYGRLQVVLGVSDFTRERAEQLLGEGSEMYDLAVRVKRTPHPFGHKFHAHLKPYFVESCRSLIEEGYHREAMTWLTPFYMTAVNIVTADGPDEVKPEYARRLDKFLQELGVGSEEAQSEKAAEARLLYEEYFPLADRIVETNPAII